MPAGSRRTDRTTRNGRLAPAPGRAILLVITSCVTEASEKRRRGGQFRVRSQSRRRCHLYSCIATQDFVANAQKFSSFVTTRDLMKPAAFSFSVKPLFGCPE